MGIMGGSAIMYNVIAENQFQLGTWDNNPDYVIYRTYE